MNKVIERATYTILWAIWAAYFGLIIEIDGPGDGVWRNGVESFMFFFGLIMVVLSGRKLQRMIEEPAP